MAIIRDATGREFFYYTLAALHDFKSSVGGTYMAGHHRAQPLRFRVPGLKRPVLEGRSSPTIAHDPPQESHVAWLERRQRIDGALAKYLK